MKIITAIAFSLLVVTGYGQEIMPDFDGHKWEAPYDLPIPKDWTIERFLIPISFAPGIPYKGVEDIRFAPGWGKINSEDYWSYAFLWFLDGAIKVDAETIESNLKAYYTGLIGMNGRNAPGKQLIPVVTSFKETKKDKGDLKAFAGTISMADYLTQKPIMLYGKVHLKACREGNKTLLFHELSPQPLSHIIWKSLDNLWLAFKCKKD